MTSRMTTGSAHYVGSQSRQMQQHSRNTTRIVFLSGLDGVWKLQNAQQLTRTGTNGQNGLDSKGGKIVFTGERADGRTIWVTDFRGGGRVAVAESGNAPALSRDGKTVVFEDQDNQSKVNLWTVGATALDYGN